MFSKTIGHEVLTMKVALVLYHFPVRSETFVIEHALALCRAGVDLTIITQKYSGDWENFDPKVAAEIKKRICLLPSTEWRRWPRQFFGTLLFSRALKFLNLNCFAIQAGRRDVIKNLPVWANTPPLGRFDAILAHFGPVGILALILRKVGLIEGPIATIFHGFDMSRRSTISRYKKGYGFLFNLSELMLPISRLWRKQLIDWGAPKHKVEVLHMGVDLPDAPPDFSRKLNLPLRILSVGRLTHKKAHTDTIEASLRCNSQVRLEVIGSGDLEEELRELARSIPYEKFKLLGPRPHRDVLKTIENADVFILPSVTASDGEMEGIPVVLMEAMARGTIVIATKHSGIPELIVHGRSGFLVNEHDPDAIAQLIDRITTGRYDLPTIRRRAFESIRAEFCNRSLNPKLLAILERLANAPPN